MAFENDEALVEYLNRDRLLIPSLPVRYVAADDPIWDRVNDVVYTDNNLLPLDKVISE